MRSAGGTIQGNCQLATQCKNAIVGAGALPNLINCVQDRFSNAVPCCQPEYKCPNDVLMFTLENIDWMPPSMPKTLGLGRFFIGEDKDMVLKIMIKGRRPIFRHVPRTQRVDTDFVHDIVKNDSVFALYINTKCKLPTCLLKAVLQYLSGKHYVKWPRSDLHPQKFREKNLS